MNTEEKLNDKIHYLERRIKRLQLESQRYFDLYIDTAEMFRKLRNRMTKALELLEKYHNGTFDERLISILQGEEQ